MQTHVLCIAAALPAEVAKAFTADRCVSSLFCSPEHVQLLVLDPTPLFFALRDGPWVWGVVEKASPEMKPQLKVVGLPFPVEPGGASNSIHIAAKADAKKKEAVWNFIVMAASPEWQRAYGLTGSPAPRKHALTAADYAANLAPDALARSAFGLAVR